MCQSLTPDVVVRGAGALVFRLPLAGSGWVSSMATALCAAPEAPACGGGVARRALRELRAMSRYGMRVAEEVSSSLQLPLLMSSSQCRNLFRPADRRLWKTGAVMRGEGGLRGSNISSG